MSISQRVLIKTIVFTFFSWSIFLESAHARPLIEYFDHVQWLCHSSLPTPKGVLLKELQLATLDEVIQTILTESIIGDSSLDSSPFYQNQKDLERVSAMYQESIEYKRQINQGTCKHECLARCNQARSSLLGWILRIAKRNVQIKESTPFDLVEKDERLVFLYRTSELLQKQVISLRREYRVGRIRKRQHDQDKKNSFEIGKMLKSILHSNQESNFWNSRSALLYYSSARKLIAIYDEIVNRLTEWSG